MRWKRLALWGGACALGAAAIVVSGVVPIKASSGHWKVTEVALHFAMRRSVATHSLAVAASPPLDDPRLILMGAGHYEGGCRFCHGAPSDEMPEVPQHMTPEPPWLPERTGEYDDEELFYIVRHGVKFTGMPAWPASDRHDEVWSLVAFLRVLEDLDGPGYRRLVRGDETVNDGAAPLVVRLSCARCHGLEGDGRGLGAFPRLAGQRPDYLRASLEAYARGSRHSGIMQPIAASLDAEQIAAAVDWYASREARPRAEAGGALGASIAREGIPARSIPACAHCHGPGHEPRHPVYPLLDGQYAPYLEQQLELFIRRVRGGTPYGEIMQDVTAHDLAPLEIDAVAAFYASK